MKVLKMGKNGWTAEQIKEKDSHAREGKYPADYRVMHGSPEDPRPIYITYFVGKPSGETFELRKRWTPSGVKIVKLG